MTLTSADSLGGAGSTGAAAGIVAGAGHLAMEALELRDAGSNYLACLEGRRVEWPGSGLHDRPHPRGQLSALELHWVEEARHMADPGCAEATWQ